MGMMVTGGCELTGNAGWLDEMADVGEIMMVCWVEDGMAEAVGMTEADGVDKTAEVVGMTEVEGVAEMTGAVDVDRLGGAERAAKSSGPGAG